MSNQTTKGRLIQIAQSYTNGGDIRRLESGEFGLGLDEGQERLWIGSNSGNIQVVTERNIAQLAVPDGSIGRTELDGEINTLLDNISNVDDMPLATTSKKGLMSSADKIKLNSIEDGANNTTIVNNLTSLSTTSALSAYQGKLLKDMIDDVAGGGSTVAVVDNLTSTDTVSALSANQGRVIKGLIDNKADKTTATTTTNGLMSASDKVKLNNLSATPVTVVNTLTSTSTTNALSAYQGKVLKELIDAGGGGSNLVQYATAVLSNNIYPTRPYYSALTFTNLVTHNNMDIILNNDGELVLPVGYYDIRLYVAHQLDNAVDNVYIEIYSGSYKVRKKSYKELVSIDELSFLWFNNVNNGVIPLRIETNSNDPILNVLSDNTKVLIRKIN